MFVFIVGGVEATRVFTSKGEDLFRTALLIEVTRQRAVKVESDLMSKFIIPA